MQPVAEMPVPTSGGDKTWAREDAALKIQAAWRGHVARSKGRAGVIRTAIATARTSAHIRALTLEAASLSRAVAAEHELLRLQGCAVKALWTKVQELQLQLQEALRRGAIRIQTSESGNIHPAIESILKRPEVAEMSTSTNELFETAEIIPLDDDQSDTKSDTTLCEEENIQDEIVQEKEEVKEEKEEVKEEKDGVSEKEQIIEEIVKEEALKKQAGHKESVTVEEKEADEESIIQKKEAEKDYVDTEIHIVEAIKEKEMEDGKEDNEKEVVEETEVKKNEVEQERVAKKNETDKETVVKEKKVVAETTDLENKETTVAQKQVVEETSVSEKVVVEETTVSEKDAVKETTVSEKDAVEETTVSEKDAVEETTVSEKDVVEETTVSVNDVVEETTVSEKDVVAETAVSEKAVEVVTKENLADPYKPPLSPTTESLPDTLSVASEDVAILLDSS